MRFRPAVLGLLLSLFLALGIALGTPWAAWAFHGPWTTVGSAGTIDEESAKIITLDGPNALLTGFQRGRPGTIRYNIVALADFLDHPFFFSAVGMRVRYRTTPNLLVPGADSRVLVKLIEVNIINGQSLTRLVLDSNDFTPSSGFQSRLVSNCPEGPNFLEFGGNAYFIEVELSKRSGLSIAPALHSISVFAGPQESCPFFGEDG